MASAPKKRSAPGKGSRPRKGPKHPWARWTNERLLDLRMRDLDLTIEGTVLEGRIDRLKAELGERDLRIAPYFWLSDDWFTAEGHTGVAIPFYLAHPRLLRLERAMMGEVEGATERWFMRLLRHEAGHVVDHSFQLHKRRRWQQLFGHSSHRYPRFYRPNPYSKRFVRHLEYWYAQSHPDEDFAETFAVWLRPRSDWRTRYGNWPALKKLEYVDELMQEIAGKKPLMRTRTRIETLRSIKKTLREYYERKLRGYNGGYSRAYDADLKNLFSEKRGKGQKAASAAIRRIRPEVMRVVSPWIGEDRYLLDHLLKEIVGRCRELNLAVQGGESRLKRNFALFLTKHAVNALYRKRGWVEM